MNIIDVIKEYKERRRYHMTNGPSSLIFFRRKGKREHFFASPSTDEIYQEEQDDDGEWVETGQSEMFADDLLADDWEVVIYEPGATDPS